MQRIVEWEAFQGSINEVVLKQTEKKHTNLKIMNRPEASAIFFENQS